MVPPALAFCALPRAPTCCEATLPLFARCRLTRAALPPVAYHLLWLDFLQPEAQLGAPHFQDHLLRRYGALIAARIVQWLQYGYAHSAFAGVAAKSFHGCSVIFALIV